jgi:hypothetical protein
MAKSASNMKTNSTDFAQTFSLPDKDYLRVSLPTPPSVLVPLVPLEAQWVHPRLSQVSLLGQAPHLITIHITPAGKPETETARERGIVDQIGIENVMPVIENANANGSEIERETGRDHPTNVMQNVRKQSASKSIVQTILVRH